MRWRGRAADRETNEALASPQGRSYRVPLLVAVSIVLALNLAGLVGGVLLATNEPAREWITDQLGIATQVEAKAARAEAKAARSELEAAFGNATGGIQDVNRRLDDAETAVEELTDRVADVESQLDDTLAEVEALTDTTEAHTAQLDGACDWARSQESAFPGLISSAFSATSLLMSVCKTFAA